MLNADAVIKVASPHVDEAEVAAVREVLLSGQFVSGKRVKAFEHAFAEYVGTEHAVAVNSGTAALHAALVAASVGPGDEVIVPAMTFFSTVTSVIHQGAIPIFADITLEDFSMDASGLEALIGRRTRALLPVHCFGHAADMDELQAVAQAHDLAVIEDCAQAHGTEHRGRRVGSIGDFGAFSFFATKHMTTGEGGIVTTNDGDAAEMMGRFRSHGMVGRDDHVMLGYNYRMTEMAAAIGIVQIGKLEGLNEDRIRVSNELRVRLADVPWMRLPVVPEHVRHTFFWLHAWIDEDALGMPTRDLVVLLRERGIEVRQRYQAPLYRQPLLTTDVPALLRAVAGDRLPDYGSLHLPNVEQVAGRMIGLPNRPDMTPEEVDRVVEVVRGIE